MCLSVEGQGCEGCYFKDSSVHRSYYRCVSIHVTDSTVIQENVAYDVVGFCYYLEDGIEENNDILYNQVAHVHMLGPELATAFDMYTPIYKESDDLRLPADVAASGFYITNVHNNIIGNTASGGWAGFAFPNLPTPLGLARDVRVRPSSALPLTIDGNTAHSTGWWWQFAGAFYFGGVLKYEGDMLTYNPGRSTDLEDKRNVCGIDLCNESDSCTGYCPLPNHEFMQITNSKTYLTPGLGISGWSGRMEFTGYESHDNGRAISVEESGILMDKFLVACRTGEPLAMPSDPSYIRADVLFWYDHGQEHILTDSTFRNCGYRSDEFNQYDNSPDRGCSMDGETGCHPESVVFGFQATADQFLPEIMQATSGLHFDKCGRRFLLHDWRINPENSSVSGRSQNWLDTDGSVSGFGVSTIIGSGLEDTGMWWQVDDNVVHDPQGPLNFVRVDDGPERGLGFFQMEWDQSLHAQIGETICGNGQGLPCPTEGYLRHKGPRFAGDKGLPVTASAEVVGLVGGYGWLAHFDKGPPKELKFTLMEIDPDQPLLFSIAYPPGTTFEFDAKSDHCWEDPEYSCHLGFQKVDTIDEVRSSNGNLYHVSDDGVLTFRIIMMPAMFVGKPDFYKASWEDYDRDGYFALDRYERKGIRLPRYTYGVSLTVKANNCGESDTYCSHTDPANTKVDEVCPWGYEQVSYDKCCQGTQCVYANGNNSVVA